MTTDTTLDLIRAHKHFSAGCFNATWDLIDKVGRTPADDEQMIRTAHASIWHWIQRPDCTPRNLSIGYWQLSRAYALAGQTDNARRYGTLCLEITPPDEPFYLGFAHEALARAELVAGNPDAARHHLASARQQAEQVTVESDKQALLADLQALDPS